MKIGMKRKGPLAHPLWLVVALAACALAAWSATLVRWRSPVQEIVPFAILCVVLALGMIFGRPVGILGSVIAAAIFACAMYPPLGSLRIADLGARSLVAWMLLAGVTLSYLLLPAHGDRTKRGG
jgi:K+-sensing histidine kinase KdpD